MSNQYTPGPWEVMNGTDVFTLNGGVCGDGRKSDDNDGWQVADCSSGVTFVDREECDLTMAECRANARLIAAAPDLLEALRGMVVAHAIPSSACKERPAYDAAIKALVKATGES